MVNDEELSLFQGIAGSAFGNYFQPDFVPVFVAPTLVGAELEAACSFATTDSIREGCIFDIAVPGDAETMAAVTEIAEAEQRERVAVISNSLPQLADSSVRLELRSGEAASVDIMATNGSCFPLTALCTWRPSRMRTNEKAPPTNMLRPCQTGMTLKIQSRKCTA